MSIIVPLVLCKASAKATIEQARTAEAFVDNTFDIKTPYRPFARLGDLKDTTRVSIIGLTDDRKPVTRGGTVTIEQPLQVAIQRMVIPTAPGAEAMTDGLVQLWEEIKDLLETTPPAGWTWLDTRSLKDESGLPYEFSRLRDANTFEVIFTIFYQRTFTRNELRGIPE